MAKVKANPLGLLEMEIIGNAVSEKGLGFDGGVDASPGFREQVPVKEGLAGQDTFKVDASSPSSRAPVELRRMGLGEDEHSNKLSGASMFKEFGGGTGGQAGDFAEYQNK